MPENQSVKFYKNPTFLLIIILAIFFLKGVFFACLYPIFSGQDEARHYNSIQYINEPKEKNWPLSERKDVIGNENIRDYNFSQEIIGSGEAADFDIFRHYLYLTANFSDSFSGQNEVSINKKIWKPYNYFTPSDVVGESIYHIIGSKIERVLENSDILIRFFGNRVFSVILGTISILFAYLIAKNIGLKDRMSLLIAAIIAFQPKFGMYFANINYDVLLIPVFFLFTLGGVLSIKNGMNWKNMSLLLFALILGILTKITAIILLAGFIFIIGFHLAKTFKPDFRKISLFSLLLIIMIYVLSLTKYNLANHIPFEENFSTTLISLGDYLSSSLTPGRLGMAARTYWGALGWNSDNISDIFTNIVWYVEMIAGAGLIYFIFSPKKLEYLPEKKYIIFLIVMLMTLQIGVRIADWNIFTSMGKFTLGTPGRYFLPNLASHIILLFVGLGALMRKEKYFHYSLITGLILMFSFSMYLMFNVIIPRYYL